jgi:D-glycero-D-manno-heptose 1,7-bisphosphate phosphatase
MPLVLLDRDGVVNEDSADFVKSPDEWRPIAGSLKAMARLKRAGFAVAICTNQSGIARGLFGVSALEAIHDRMRRELARQGGALDGIYVCPHGPEDRCTCRKPRAGLLSRAMAELGIGASSTHYIGDSVRDMQAALTAGCTPILVRTGNGLASETAARELGVVHVHDDLASATDWILTACSE